MTPSRSALPDEWADLDLGILVEAPQRYLRRHFWLRQPGSPLAKYLDPSGVTLHVLFEDGADAGFGFLPVSTFKQAVRSCHGAEIVDAE